MKSILAFLAAASLATSNLVAALNITNEHSCVVSLP